MCLILWRMHGRAQPAGTRSATWDEREILKDAVRLPDESQDRQKCGLARQMPEVELAGSVVSPADLLRKGWTSEGQGVRAESAADCCRYQGKGLGSGYIA